MSSNISIIYEQENIGDSLVKINNNFVNLDNSVVALSGTLSNAINETAFRSVSSKYESTYTTVQNNSASWEESADITNLATTIQNASGNWNSAYNVSTIYQSTSSSFATNTLLQSTSALLTPLTLTNTLTGQLVLNTDFDSYKTEVASATGTLVLNTDFDSYKTEVASATASNISYTHSNFLPLTGGTLTGNLSVLGDIAIGSTTLPALTAETAGAISTYLVVRINGTQYKLPLYAI